MSLTHFAAPCQQLFFVFVKFFHRSGEVVFVSAVREATLSSTACQQLFSTFRFFLSLDALSSSRSGKLFVSALAVNNFFQLSKNSFSEPFVSPSSRRSLCACQTLARRSLSATARREKRLWTLSRQRSRSFFQNVTKKEAALWKEGCFFFCFRKLDSVVKLYLPTKICI